MIFNENVSAELQEILNIELHRYRKEITDITDDELEALLEWVASGHSPYTNGDFVHDEEGWPMDYVNTLRFWDSFQESYEQSEEIALSDFEEDIVQ